MTEKQAIWKSILHWRRMIKWVEGQNKKKKVKDEEMLAEIGEDWGGEWCALCMIHPNLDCFACSLSKKYGECCSDDKNAWRNVCQSKTAAGWLYHARRLLKQLESLREPKGKKS